MIRSAAFGGLLSLVLAMTAACGTSSETTESEGGGGGYEACPTKETTGDIVLSASANLGVFGSVLLAQETGAFADAGLNVTIERLSAADSLPLVAQGQIDAQMTSYSSAQFNAVNGGVDVKWVMPFDTQQKYDADAVLPGFWAREDVVGTGAEPDLSALKGKTVGSPTQGTGVAGKILDDALAKDGLGLGDVTMTRLVGADALTALQNNAVSATWIAAPLEIEAAKIDGLRPIASYPPGVTGTSLIAGPKLLDRPEVLVKFLQVVSETVKEHMAGDYRTDPETAQQLATLLETDVSVVQESALLVFDPELSMAGSDKFLDDLQKFFIAQKALDYDEPIAADKLVDTSFVDAARSCSRDWMS